MNNYQVKKVENCFKDSQTYEYRVNLNLDDEIIKKFSVLGEVIVKNYRRPIFMINCINNTKIKGIINSNIIKVSFEDSTWEERKNEFEIFLEELLK